MSRPARGGWIEITILTLTRNGISSRPARGGWIEMGSSVVIIQTVLCPVPQGAGGLKYQYAQQAERSEQSPVPQGAGGLK